MPNQTRIVTPGPDKRTVIADGKMLQPPEEWTLVPPGDAALTRRIKAAGPTWTVQEKNGRKTFSLGVWASAEAVAKIQRELAAERADPAYAKRRAADGRRREKKQVEYVGSFRQAVLDFLAFAPRFTGMAEELADAVSAHATPVGSGTVARTERIPVERRAEAAVIAWMRHQTTAYDQMPIARVKGRRREVRRQLAQRSRQLLDAYRIGHAAGVENCPLLRALSDMKT